MLWRHIKNCHNNTIFYYYPPHLLLLLPGQLHLLSLLLQLWGGHLFLLIMGRQELFPQADQLTDHCGKLALLFFQWLWCTCTEPRQQDYSLFGLLALKLLRLSIWEHIIQWWLMMMSTHWNKHRSFTNKKIVIIAQSAVSSGRISPARFFTAQSKLCCSQWSYLYLIRNKPASYFWMTEIDLFS